MTTETTRTVKVGGTDYTISRFRGLKATRILREAAVIGRRFPKITKLAQEFERQYAENNALILERTEAEAKFGEGAREISDKAWEMSGGTLRLKRMPSGQDKFFAVFPELLDAAEDAVIRLLALISATNEELKEADQGDGVEDFLNDRGKTLLYEGDVEELANLALAGFEVARGQFAPLQGKVQELATQLGATFGQPKSDDSGTMGSPSSQSPKTTSSERTETEKPTSEESSGTSSKPSPTSQSSSTDSPTPTAGADPPSSTTPPGALSGASSNG